jgi:PBP1b-binding outer membrane lipoprotein LpoB
MKNQIIIAVTALFLASCATTTQEEVVPTIDSTIVILDTTAINLTSVPTPLSVPTPSIDTTTVK